ncbi:mannosyltransferase [Nakamurella leprariae]|uniref:Mannosyltransferase n=1 Tax=Nakamurella leprariae TaxID=2803911 RepID=A0A939C016_9ACTN|nr:mannosyltransferase [Nakamurella leprariae]MBM9468296.1 mannosyltransferase [Nakamurella leprariae]
MTEAGRRSERRGAARLLDRFLGSPGPWVLLAATLVLHVVATVAGADPFAMVDLEVYVEGSRHLGDGLYDFVTLPLELPFTYPPFSAMLFLPLGWLPWTVTRVLWQVASFAALAAIVFLSLKLLGRAGRGATRPVPHVRGVVVTGTAVGLWLEPVRTTFNYGQINLFLVALLLAGAAAVGPRRELWAGFTVGLAAGIKLTPAITGLFYLVQRRWSAVLWSVAAFAVTVLIAVAVLPSQTWRYWTELIFDPGRTGPVWSAINQSLRGALARLAGHDVSTAWYLAVLLAVALGVTATVLTARAGDRAAALLAVQLTGLLVSPISWSHHWVWVVPLLLWCLLGPSSRLPAVRVLAGLWLAGTLSYVVSLLIARQDPDQPATRPGWESWLGTVYPVLGLLTLALLLVLGLRAGRAATAVPGPAGARR